MHFFTDLFIRLLSFGQCVVCLALCELWQLILLVLMFGAWLLLIG